MRVYDSIGVQVPRILLPKKNLDMTKWAVVACDQYTSQPDYWKKVDELVGSFPSTFRIIYPEIYLEEADKEERIKKIQDSMKKYLNDSLFEEHEAMVYVERKLRSGKVRRGIVLAFDLEKYDYAKGSQSLIRATEGTILERIPPRMKIRENAMLESPHIMILIDDPKKTVIEPVASVLSVSPRLKKLYDFELMMDSGHLTGYAIDYASEAKVIAALRMLASPNVFKKKYGLKDMKDDKPVLLFAMGDGNHSLATAKAIWEKIKENSGNVEAELADNPARYALAEIVNLHDESLVFEPIHRIIFSLRVDAEGLLKEMEKYYPGKVSYKACSGFKEMKQQVSQSNAKLQRIGFVNENGIGLIEIADASHSLAVGTLQAFLDDFMAKKAAEKIDYVHGDEIVQKLGSEKGNAGFYLPAMAKDELFKAVILSGVVPRKTFSMGEADEKRFYMECRKIR
ncbi:DUF1015 domain-containing protein [Candidatus Woesearchaeota archaeon]|nr:DUF1015 domain-containing protein [Candidatus Woesearchaeota archaeon]